MRLLPLPALLLLTGLAATTWAWSLDLYTTDGRHSNMHGHTDSGCVNIDFSPALTVNRARYDPATANFPDVTDTFELYVNRNCQRLSYRNNKGEFTLTPPRQIRSYKVY